MRPAMIALAAALAASTARAETFPDKPIHIIVPFSPGSATDVAARAVAQQLSQKLDQPVVVDNRPSAGGTISAAHVARSAPDGYTLLVHSSGHTVNPSIYANPGYDTQDNLMGVSMLAVGSAKRSSLPPDIQTIEEAGYPGSAYRFWVGMLAPAGTPPAVVERLNADVKEALASPQIKERLAALGADAAPTSPADFDKLIAQELVENAALAKEAGIKHQ
jgi:tripartite-type tricarboxylate transporter receptor subunit TctC